MDGKMFRRGQKVHSHNGNLTFPPSRPSLDQILLAQLSQPANPSLGPWPTTVHTPASASQPPPSLFSSFQPSPFPLFLQTPNFSPKFLSFAQFPFCCFFLFFIHWPGLSLRECFRASPLFWREAFSTLLSFEFLWIFSAPFWAKSPLSHSPSTLSLPFPYLAPFPKPLSLLLLYSLYVNPLPPPLINDAHLPTYSTAELAISKSGIYKR